MREKRKKNKMNWNLLLGSFFVCLLLAGILENPYAVYAVEPPADFKAWGTLPSVSTSDSKGYYQITDMRTYGSNLTNDMSAGDSYYNSLHYYSATRITYQKKFSVSYGTKINLSGSLQDNGSGGLNTSAIGTISWNVMEWDQYGGFLWDSGWIETNEAYAVGTDQRGKCTNAWGTDYSVGSRSTVAYITILFRFVDETGYDGAGAIEITPANVAEYFPNMFLCFKPFTYTVDYSGYGTNTTINRLGTERISLDISGISNKTGYDIGWKVMSSSSVGDNWMNGKEYKAAQINTWLSDGNFYNSLFGNVTFKAVYIPNVYTITLDNQGATTAGTDKYYQKYDSGNYSDAGCTTATSSITVPQKNGYKFNGYYTGTNGSGTQYINSSGAISSSKTTFTANTTLYAYWTVDSFSVKYHANGGSTTATEKIYYYGEAVDLSPTATKEGYTFVGWSTLLNARLPLISYSMPDKAVTLYAIYTINVSDVQNHEYPSYAGTPLVDNDEVYFLVWIKGDSSIYKYYPLTFKGNVGHMTYRYELPSTDVSAFVNGRTYCYQIIAWDNAGNKAVLYDGSSDGTPIPPGDVPEEPVKYTQTVEHYKYNAATGSWGWFKDTKTFVVEGSTFTPSYTTPPTGYQTESKDGGGIVTGNKTYKAYYKPINYLVTFQANGGSCNTASKYVAYEGYYGTLPTATKTGQEFAGWNTKQDGTGKNILSSDIYTTAGTTTLYAQYKANTYRIVLDNQGATTAGTLEYFQKYNAGNYTTQECNTAIASIVIPQKKGYTFGGYYTGTNGSGTQHINSAGVIGSTKTTFTVDTTLYAAWTENSYTIRYHANGGTGTMADTEAVYDTSVTLRANSFERIGYTFIGWSASPTGSKVYNDLDSVKNLTAASGEVITLYAVWSLNSYLVIYDYQTNGGGSASVTEKMVGYGSDIDLSVAAVKEGYTFVGWNTDASATTKLTSLTMTTEPVMLFAIFQKTITVIFVEMGDAGTVTNSVSKTVYNNTKYADFLMEEKTSWSSWKNAGWTNETAADADALVSTAGTYRTDKSITLYALYTSDVTVSYDTNGSHATYESQTKPRYYNASGNSMYPAFTIAKAPKLSGNSFVNWIGKSGTEYVPETNAVIEESVCLTAKWDAHPVLEVYNRYFTLEQAQSGAITQEELLKKVIGTDKEDGTLLNGTSVVVKDYSASTFTGITADKEVEITYQARDSFGNTVTKKVSVFITDTLVKEGRKKHYVRFISFDFWRDDSGNLLAAEQGGVEKTSVWRINSNYRMLLEKTLSNQNTYKESWIFTPQDIQSIKDSTRMYGHISNALEQFLKLFEKCKENKNPTG